MITPLARPMVSRVFSADSSVRRGGWPESPTRRGGEDRADGLGLGVERVERLRRPNRLTHRPSAPVYSERQPAAHAEGWRSLRCTSGQRRSWVKSSVRTISSSTAAVIRGPSLHWLEFVQLVDQIRSAEEIQTCRPCRSAGPRGVWVPGIISPMAVTPAGPRRCCAAAYRWRRQFGHPHRQFMDTQFMIGQRHEIRVPHLPTSPRHRPPS